MGVMSLDFRQDCKSVVSRPCGAGADMRHLKGGGDGQCHDMIALWYSWVLSLFLYSFISFNSVISEGM